MVDTFVVAVEHLQIDFDFLTNRKVSGHDARGDLTKNHDALGFEFNGSKRIGLEWFSSHIWRWRRVMVLGVGPHLALAGKRGGLKLGAVAVAIDPGMGFQSYLNCVRHARPTALVAVRTAHWLSLLPFAAFQSLEHRVTVGGRHWRAQLGQCTSSDPRPLAAISAHDPAAILFTSGSTGAPKGVAYTHGMFDAQIELVRSTYGIQPGEVDMPMLPMFALFNPALGMTTVTPLLNPTKPASADPAPIVAALISERVTNSFGSPAIWARIADHCEQRRLTLPHLRRVLIAGAPVPDRLLEQLLRIAPQAQIHTPYGATDCLPVSTIEAKELLATQRDLARQGGGTCVGRAVAGVEIRIIRETEGPLLTLAETTPCPPGEVGEIIVTGPSVTRAYDGLPAATALAKIADGERVWHRMGDLGAIGADGLLRFFEALRTQAASHPQAAAIQHIFFQKKLPVDVRHNAKIHRLQLSKEWTARTRV